MDNRYLRCLANILFFVAIILGICLVLPRLASFFMPFVVGWIISLIANPLVRFLEKRLKIIRKHGSMIVIVGAIALVVLLGYLLVTWIWRLGSNLAEIIPGIIESLSQDIQDSEGGIQKVLSIFLPNMTDNVSDLIDSLTTLLTDAVSAVGMPTVAYAGNIAKNIPGVLISTIFIILSAYLFVAEHDRIIQWTRDHMPDTLHTKWRFVLDNFKKAVGGYFKAQFKIMGVVAVILLVGFLIVGVNYAVLFAIVIAVLDFLPFLGTGTALIPWAVLKIFTGDYKMAVGLLLIYVVSQAVRQLIQPKIVGDTIGLDSMSTLVCMFIGYKVGGILAMIIAVPIGMIIVSLYHAGAFDDVIDDAKTLMSGFNEYRKGGGRQKPQQ